ncbi:YadA-like family protein [Psychrilyobacter atlanticus]|uniref:YadA-like family protein n=1 Tax=Psychrilyobacter atlanticus TaxID=271091 RepID=UPI00041B250C|nr:YadA-like family protein [Psychrilyobacter atlanticus]
MKKKVLLLGTLAILSTGSYGIDMESYGMFRKTNLENFKKTENMIDSVERLGATVVRDKVSESDAIKGFGKAQEADQKAQSEAFDKVVDGVLGNKDAIESNEATLKSMKSDLFTRNEEGDLVPQSGVNREDIATLGKNMDGVNEKIDGVDLKTELNSHAIDGMAVGLDIESGRIDNVETTLGKHAEELARLDDVDQQLADKDKKLEAVDADLKEKDEKLEIVDATMQSNMRDIAKHNGAIYEEGVTYRDGAPVVKADANRGRIETLELARATTEEQTTKNTGDIATNKAKTEENKEEIDRNAGQINQALELADHNSEYIENNSKRIDGLEKKVDGLESKMNKGLAMAAATSSIVYPHLGKGDLGIGAGIGGYGGSQAIAIGVAMQPTENVRINTNVSTSDTSDTMYGAGVGYKFNIFGS